MSRRLLRLEIPVLPMRGMFRVLDADVDPHAPGGPPPPDGALITSGRDQMVIACGQQHVSVQLTIEEWEDAPPPFSDGYEDEAKCVLYLRGRLSIVDISRTDSALAAVRLAGGVGDYVVRVYTRNRADAGQRYAALFNGNADPLSDDFQQAKKRLDGLEQYLVQLWRES
jgi:hypothetical protein